MFYTNKETPRMPLESYSRPSYIYFLIIVSETDIKYQDSFIIKWVEW